MAQCYRWPFACKKILLSIESGVISSKIAMLNYVLFKFYIRFIATARLLLSTHTKGIVNAG